MTDAYLDNMLGENVYRGKMDALRNEEDELKKSLAGIELLAMERERSGGYLNRVKDSLDGYDDGLTKVNFDHKRQMAGLLFKNIKIARREIFSFEFFAPFNSLFLEQEKKEKCLKNQHISPKISLGSILRPLAAFIFRFYNT